MEKFKMKNKKLNKYMSTSSNADDNIGDCWCITHAFLAPKNVDMKINK